ncbi:MAG: hypothetical protein U0992_12470 [Planctomycetaceae bacterium]
MTSPAHFCSTPASSRSRITRVYGSRGCLTADFDAQSVVLHRNAPAERAGRLETPRRDWRQSARSLRRNIWRFVRSDLHYFAGMPD